MVADVLKRASVDKTRVLKGEVGAEKQEGSVEMMKAKRGLIWRRGNGGETEGAFQRRRSLQCRKWLDNHTQMWPLQRLIRHTLELLGHGNCGTGD